jgi:hypothetical protein
MAVVHANFHVASEKPPRFFPGVDGGLFCETVVFIAAIIAQINSSHTVLRLSASTLVFWRKVTIRPGRLLIASLKAVRATL